MGDRSATIDMGLEKGGAAAAVPLSEEVGGFQSTMWPGLRSIPGYQMAY